MKRIFQYFLVCLPFLFVWVDGQSQVIYTSNGSCASNFGAYFTTAACWTKTSSCTPDPNIPPANGTVACPVIFDIEHEINIPNLTIGSNVTIRVNTGGILNLTGNLTKSGETSGTIGVDGGEVQVAGNLIMENGKNNDSTGLFIDIRNDGIFNVNGGLLDVGNEASLTIDGDSGENSVMTVQSFNFGQKSNVYILLGGGLNVTGDVDYRGNNSAINIHGYFKTGGSVLITGGNGNQLNAFSDAEVIVTANLDVRGTSDITFGGTSETDIGGDIIVSGNSKVIAEEQAIVYVCGEMPPITSGTCPNNSQACELATGIFNQGCRLLPVDFLYTEASYSELTRNTDLRWATSKEWENSHFEIERSLEGVSAFQKVGEVQGMGWKDTLTEYIFEDNGIPLSGGIIYYRLKQVDFNGKFVYSKVLSVQASGLSFTKGVWRAFPNPTSGESFRLDILNPDEYHSEEIQVKLISPSFGGQMVNGFELSEISAQLTDMLKNSPMGVYILEISWGHKIEHVKVLKK